MTETSPERDNLEIFPREHQIIIKDYIERVKGLSAVNSISAGYKEDFLLITTELLSEKQDDHDALVDEGLDFSDEIDKKGKMSIALGMTRGNLEEDDLALERAHSRGVDIKMVYRKPQEL